MAIQESDSKSVAKTILYLTDFSQPSEAALPFVVAMARNYSAIVYALHISVATRDTCKTPEIRVADEGVHERLAVSGMQELDTVLSGVDHKIIVARGISLWPAIEQAIKDHDIHLIVMGTHGRTGTLKLLLGSVAEEVFRRSPVPVLTIGPRVCGGAHADVRFRRVLFATDFEPDSDRNVLFAISLAQREQGELILLHVVDRPERGLESLPEPSVSEIMHELYEMIPKGAELSCRSNAVVKYGDPSKQIIETARLCSADLIVLGLHDHASTLETATHLENSTAHKVIVQAPCPVLTVRGTKRKSWIN